VGVFTVFFTFFYANLIVPLFNKQVPLATGALRTAIDNFAHKVGFSLDNIFVLDGSKRSTKANAYFTGLGAKKRIVLYDTLIQEHTSEELVAVLAHEIGHYKLKHSRNGLILGLLIIGVTLFLFSLFIAPQGSFAIMSSQAFGVLPSFHIGAVLFAILFGPITELFGVFQNYWSRKNEYQADRFAAKHADAQALISALSKLSKNNLTNLNPHPFYVFVNFSHPPLLFRIQEIQKIK
jgi:STE24 endopeptidase